MKVIADDFLVVAFEDTDEEARSNHDKNLRAFLDRAQQRDLKLAPEPAKLQLRGVTLMGDRVTSEGLQADPEKLNAILQMPTLTDAKFLKQALGTTNHLSKFLPKLSEVCSALRQLDHKHVEWHWQDQHERAWQGMKRLVATTPVLAFYDPQKEATIQCNASQDGLGATLMQEGVPSVLHLELNQHQKKLHSDRERTISHHVCM